MFFLASKKSSGLKSYIPAALFFLSVYSLFSNLYTPAFLIYTLVFVVYSPSFPSTNIFVRLKSSIPSIICTVSRPLISRPNIVCSV